MSNKVRLLPITTLLLASMIFITSQSEVFAENAYITTDRAEYTYTQDLDIVISGNIGDLQLPVKIEVQCDILPTPSTTWTYNNMGPGYGVDVNGNFEYSLATLGFGCYGQTSSATVRIQGTDISASFQMIGEDPQSDPETPPTTTILSFEIDINTDPSVNYGFPLGTLHGQTSQGDEGLYIVLRDPDGQKVWNHPRIADSNGYFDYRFDIGNPTVLIKEGTYTAIAHLYTETEEEGLRVTFENYFADEPEDPVITEFSIDKDSYTEGETIFISGHIENHWPDYPAVIHVDTNLGSQLPFDVPIDSNGDFETQIIAGGDAWTASGTYTLGLLHISGGYVDYTTFEYIIPEPEPEPEPEPIPDKKITICHIPPGNENNPQTITISENAWSAHQNHGDTIGECLVKSSDGLVSIPAGTSVPGCEDTTECFVPSNISINVGETVTWSNDDFAAHTVTSGNPGDPVGVFDSSLILADATFSYTFDESGVYPYFCLVHPWMEGKVTVSGDDYTSNTVPEPSPEPEPSPQPTLNVPFNYCSGTSTDSLLGNKQIVVFTDKPSYKFGETMLVSGEVKDLPPIDWGDLIPISEPSGPPVTIQIISAGTGNIVNVAQIEVGENNRFCWEVATGGALWLFKGTYTINANYAGEGIASTTFEWPDDFTPNKLPTATQTPIESDAPYLGNTGDDGETGVNTLEEALEIANEKIDSVDTKHLSKTFWSDKSIYEDGSIIKIEGKIKQDSPRINLKVYNPSNLNISDETVILSENGKFEATLDTSHYLWYENGAYIIQIEDDNGKINQIQVKVVEPGSMPESSTVSLLPPVDATPDNNDLSQLIEENKKLREELERQGQEIDELNKQVDYLGEIIASLQGIFSGWFS